MKKEIHPEYKVIDVICSCGNTFATRSTARGDKLRVEVCNECHPFYTGKTKLLDTAGQIDRFYKRYGVAKKPQPETPAGG